MSPSVLSSLLHSRQFALSDTRSDTVHVFITLEWMAKRVKPVRLGLQGQFSTHSQWSSLGITMGRRLRWAVPPTCAIMKGKTRIEMRSIFPTEPNSCKFTQGSMHHLRIRTSRVQWPAPVLRLQTTRVQSRLSQEEQKLPGRPLHPTLIRLQ
jgi:hypothetical protein